MNKLIDKHNRIHNYLRISLTDKCNLSCLYCNPSGNKQNVFNCSDILNDDEILRIIKIFAGALSFRKIRFTGGEPLVRKGILKLFESVSALKSEYNFEIGLTTNGTLLKEMLAGLKQFGVDKLNISLDSLKADKFKRITGRSDFENVISSINQARVLEFNPLKINVVVLKNINDDEIIDFIKFSIERSINVRFIEFMPFGNNEWSKNLFLPWQEMKSRIEQVYHLIPFETNNGAVAKDFVIENTNAKVSFISSISDHFCSSCNRLRITANGQLRLCLFSNGNGDLDLKELLRNPSVDDQTIVQNLQNVIGYKSEKHPSVEELLTYQNNEMLTIGG